NPVSYETLVGAQVLAAETGWTLEAAVVGTGISSIAQDVATKKVSKVYAIESDKLTPYTPDGFAAALKSFLQQNKPRLVLMPHTYQARNFASYLRRRLAAYGSSNRVFWSDGCAKAIPCARNQRSDSASRRHERIAF